MPDGACVGCVGPPGVSPQRRQFGANLGSGSGVEFDADSWVRWAGRHGLPTAGADADQARPCAASHPEGG